MPDLVYGTSSFERRRGDFPPLPLSNMFAESVPTEPGIALQSRPGLELSSVTMGSGPIRGLFTTDGVLDNSLFGVSGSTLFKGSTALSGITGSGHVSFAGYEDYLFVNAGGNILGYNGSTVSPVTFPDSANVLKIVVGASRLVAIRAGTGSIYWTGPLGVTVDDLSFATAENSPDALLDMLYVGDKLILFGSETIEFWPVTGDSNLPFAPLVGATLPVGIKATGTATEFSRSFAWITNHDEVCVGSPDNIVSEPELQTRIAESASVSLWTFYVDRNEYLAVRLDNETWAFGARSQVWTKLDSYGESNWLCHHYDNGYFGSTANGTLIQWSDGYTDFGGLIDRRLRAWAPLTAESITVGNVSMRTNPGTTSYASGEFSDPEVELRTSRDGGHEWQPWKSRSLGRQGKYRNKVFWSSLGQFSFPGLLVEVRVTDPVDFRLSGLAYNVPFGGR